MVEVLIADDNPLQRKLLTLALSEDANIIVTAESENGEEVLRLVNEKSFDVVILDIELSKKSGIEVFRELKMQGKNIPVIMVSNYPKEDFENAVLSMGVTCYIEKSEMPDKIIEAVNNSVRNV